MDFDPIIRDHVVGRRDTDARQHRCDNRERKTAHCGARIQVVGAVVGSILVNSAVRWLG